MHTFNHKRDVSFDMDQMASLVLDVDSYKLFLPWVKDSKTYDHKDTYFTGELTFDYKGFKQSYTSRVIFEHEENKISVKTLALDGPFKILKSCWIIEKKEMGSHLDFSIEVEFSNFIYSKLFLSMFSEITEKTINAFLKRAENLLGGK